MNDGTDKMRRDFQVADYPQGFSHGEWTELARMVDEGYERFWRKRGGMPDRNLLKDFRKKKSGGKEGKAT